MRNKNTLYISFMRNYTLIILHFLRFVNAVFEKTVELFIYMW